MNVILSAENLQMKNQNEKHKSKTKLVIISGDSMIKHTSGWEIAKKLKPECKVFVRTFPGATTQCMADYMKPSIQAKPNHFIPHFGANDLNSNNHQRKSQKQLLI